MLVVGETYEFIGETGANPRAKDKSGRDEYLNTDEPIYLEYNNERIQYMKSIITMDSGQTFTCIELNPTVLKVDKVHCPMLLSSVEQNNRKLIMEFLKKNSMSMVEFGAWLLYDICIPMNMRDFSISDESVLVQNLCKWLEDSVEEYEGSWQGYMSSREHCDRVWMYLYGEQVARCLKILVDSYYPITFDKSSQIPTPMFNGKTIKQFVDDVSGIADNKAKTDDMLQYILGNKKESSELSTMDSFAAVAFQHWYDSLADNVVELLKAVSPDLEEAARKRNASKLSSYGEAGLRQSMALIFGAMSYSGPQFLYNFYTGAYTSLSTKGWEYLYLKTEVRDLYKCLCSVLIPDDNFNEARILSIQEELMQYMSNNITYETRF